MTMAPMRLSWLRYYAPLVLIRIIASVFALGMVHPDEFFQSQEVMARHVLATSDPQLYDQLHLPWEYKLPTPNRSVLFPALIAGLPYQLLMRLGLRINGFVLLLTPRLLLCILSFGIDALLYHCARALRHRDPKLVVLSFASSWTTWIFMSRPFSNTCETIVFALCMAVLLCFNPHRRAVFGIFHQQTLVLGSLLAIGFFTRFTFLVFFLPLGVELVRRQDERLVESLTKKTVGSAASWPSLGRRSLAALWIAFQGFLAFAFWSLVIVAIDTMYFRPEVWSALSSVQLRDLVVAPWNNLVYNMQYDNLELHGVHPRITHAVVNMPMLFGPLFLGFVRSLMSQTNTVTVHRIWQASCVLVPLIGLSLAPHQEPRFLLPMLIPLHLFAPSVISSRRHTGIWLVFNVLLAVFFGVLHQGGLVPFLLALSSPHATLLSITSCQLNQLPSLLHNGTVLPPPIVFYKTYMPPRFLLAGAQKIYPPGLRVVDLAGGSAGATQLDAISSEAHVLVVAPASVEVHPVATQWHAASKVNQVGHCFPHLSTEDLALDRPFTLNVYLLSKAE